MSAIVIKTEKDDECEDVKPVIKEGGGVGSAGGGGVSGSIFANVRPKAIAIEKTQAALKVANEAKQLNLRLKEQQPTRQQQPAQGTNQIGKRASSIAAEQLQAENNDTTNLPLKMDSKRFRGLQTPIRNPKKINTPTPPPPPPLQPPPPIAPPTKCGEIFVTNNASKWTFVCTFCKKTTRDIGEFVCHIQFKHMPQQYCDEDYEGEGTILQHQEEELNNEDDTYNNHDQDYFDCANYLDVNVHTEADELPTNNGVKAKANAKSLRQKTSKTDNQSRQVQKSKYVVDLLDDDDEQDQEQEQAAKGQDNVNQQTEMFDYEMEEDEDGVEIVDDDNDELEAMEDDNLLLLRSSSIEDATGEGGGGGVGGKGGSKKYRSHVRGKAYCNLCDKTFQYYSLYRNHMIKHSNVTPYKCQYCSKAFKSKQAIRYHMNTHTKEVQYTCPLCPMVYGTENQFITHVLNHESATCFPCMVCAKILKSDQERDEHLSTHSEERPFACSFCNKRFRQKHHLSNHLKLHCHYRCDFCKEEFSSTQTQRRPYACPLCEEYPEVRIQVEKQRSKTLNNSDVNPLEIKYENMTQDAADTTECVDLATDDEDAESETSTSLLGGANGQKRVTCQYCTRSYKQNSALNYHMRQKHSHIWRDMK